MESLLAALDQIQLNTIRGVSFAGKALKLDTGEDAKDIVEAINNCPILEYLNLEGNTLGIDASKAIAKALETRKEFQRALWKDLFTGRMKTEIPVALEHLGEGLLKSEARLTELDLSDNAFGPIGVKGLAALLKSSCCYNLQQLRLNNNGLGITGGRLLAGALTECYNKSKEAGKPLALKVFIAGRNRLENDGAQALAAVFQIIGTLEEIEMPQNGIYHKGVSYIAEALKCNPGLTVLNLNDNTLSVQGAKALSEVLPLLPDIRVINFGDCLLKTEGAKHVAKGIEASDKLEELILNCNEIRLPGGMRVVEAVAKKKSLKVLNLSGNQFGVYGVDQIECSLEASGQSATLTSLDDDEGDDDDTDENETSDSEQEEEELVVDDHKELKVTAQEFLQLPSSEKFMGMCANRSEELLTLAKSKYNTPDGISAFLEVVMNTTSIAMTTKGNAFQQLVKSAELLYKEIFTWAQANNKLSSLNNTLLVYLGLIKSEDKKFKPKWNVEGCLIVLENVLDKNFVPQTTKDTLKVFIQRDVDSKKEYFATKQKLLNLLAA